MLTEYVSMIEQRQTEKDNAAKRNKMKEEQGKKIREAALENCKQKKRSNDDGGEHSSSEDTNGE